MVGLFYKAVPVLADEDKIGHVGTESLDRAALRVMDGKNPYFLHLHVINP